MADRIFPGRGMMKWMIAGKLSLHDGCHYINPDHADHKDPIVWPQTRPKELSIYFSITRNQAPQADPQKMETKCRPTFSPHHIRVFPMIS